MEVKAASDKFAYISQKTHRGMHKNCSKGYPQCQKRCEIRHIAAKKNDCFLMFDCACYAFATCIQVNERSGMFS